MERSVEECECRALAGAAERAAIGERVPPLDVRRRQCAERSRNLRERDIGEMPRLERGEPAIESFARVTHG